MILKQNQGSLNILNLKSVLEMKTRKLSANQEKVNLENLKSLHLTVWISNFVLVQKSFKCHFTLS